MSIPVDISENYIREHYPEEMNILLLDRATGENIFWATDSYKAYKEGFQYNDHITYQHITGDFGKIIQPRALKSRVEQAKRVKNMAEVFTPSWVCNLQNNLIDNAWFGRENVFNIEYIDEEGVHRWTPVDGPIEFPAKTGKKSWKSFVRDLRLEITCGEGPYMVSRYDTVSGEYIPLSHRIGFLDRKLRIVGEHTSKPKEWTEMAKDALKASYGYEWQGDNLLLARESVFASFIEYYEEKFNLLPQENDLREVAEIISWNIWQMDGLKMVVPNSCDKVYETDLFGETKRCSCSACEKGEHHGHIGVPCVIRNWWNPEGKQIIQFSSIIKSL